MYANACGALDVYVARLCNSLSRVIVHIPSWWSRTPVICLETQASWYYYCYSRDAKCWRREDGGRTNINCSCEVIFVYILYSTSEHLLTSQPLIYRKSSNFTVAYPHWLISLLLSFQACRAACLLSPIMKEEGIVCGACSAKQNVCLKYSMATSFLRYYDSFTQDDLQTFVESICLKPNREAVRSEGNVPLLRNQCGFLNLI